uniref:D site-binding protein n=1 Tax=Phascolarctos cinereus TaxID=38626 RepID=A0A6P5LPG3_PHACI|nr:D site-binding protein [Phascolarctos cinereus]
MARPSSDRSPAPQLLGGPAGGAALHGLRSLLQGPGKTKELPASCLLKEKERKAVASGSEEVGGLLGVSGRPRSGPGPGALLASLLWERPLPFGDVDDVDLDAFLLEHGLPPSPPDPGPPAPRAAPAPNAVAPSCSSSSSSPSPGHAAPSRASLSPPPSHSCPGPASRDTPSPVDPESVEVLMTFDPDPADLALSSVPGQDTFDPRKHRFSEEELKPQPIMKKAPKMQVPEEQKDEKYWSRRYKNNEAAKRSRDARRLKENQISVRAAFLEKENALLRQEVVAVRQELSHYRAVLSRYQAQHGAL